MASRNSNRRRAPSKMRFNVRSTCRPRCSVNPRRTETRVTPMPHVEVQQDEFIISADPALLDLEKVCGVLEQTYWGRMRPREMMRKAISNSLAFGVYRAKEQIGFARAITDYATYAYLADVIIFEPFRGRGLGKRLIQSIFHHPQLQGIRRWGLITQDAQDFYKPFGFHSLDHPDHHMEIRHADS